MGQSINMWAFHVLYQLHAWHKNMWNKNSASTKISMLSHQLQHFSRPYMPASFIQNEIYPWMAKFLSVIVLYCHGLREWLYILFGTLKIHCFITIVQNHKELGRSWWTSEERLCQSEKGMDPLTHRFWCQAILDPPQSSTQDIDHHLWRMSFINLSWCGWKITMANLKNPHPRILSGKEKAELSEQVSRRRRWMNHNHCLGGSVFNLPTSDRRCKTFWQLWFYLPTHTLTS